MSSKNSKARKQISVEEFDALFERGNGEGIIPYLDFSKAVVVRRVNVDFPDWMIQRLDQEALKLNVSRQAVIKMWLSERMARPGAERAKAKKR